MFKYMIQEFNRDDRDYRRFFQSRNVSLSSFNKSKSLINERNINAKNIASNIIQHFLRHAVRDGFFH